MSTKAKLTLAASIIFTTAVVYTVHDMQIEERTNMHQGVLRDDERKRQKQQNILDLEYQRQLQAHLEKDQTVSRKTSAVDQE
ncbi:hypothetical protein K493DRAFT_315216 [Basidiobolus meristosporus CBS 931.73]|uniref:Cytochrome c oxidase assembly protein n=1 Tax=Basidiobolus meristosporus CBS 931.73 TaxID=1314790 RepID=A0A1Y1YBN3_9FUNG|nr:hypothetical protein K493DRAFT_315216 [Basidiobolus meristosporus CBS 931.73]|eukprot:ORX95014.1 hypothetical protein K493DRAFT_315216 [Basidiobolus meristosporus CBS 931.73]